MSWRVAGIAVAMLGAVATAELSLKLERFDGPAASFREPVAGTVEIEGAMSVRATPSATPAKGPQVLEMEYFCAGGVPKFAVLPGPPFEAKTANWLPPVGHSEAWTSYRARVDFSGDWQQLRLDLPLPAGRVLQVRNARLRPERAGEFDQVASSARAADKAVLEAYLAKTFPARVTQVIVGKEQVRVSGSVVGESGNLFLAEIPMEIVEGDPQAWETLVEVTANAAGEFSAEMPRLRPRGSNQHDRLLSRWQLVRKEGDRITALSHARYADQIACRSPQLKPAEPRSKKGLGGWHRGLLPDELKDLGISAVTVNVMIHSLVALEPGPDTTPFQWQGRTYHAREKALEDFDQTFLEAQKHGVMVSAILLVANPAKDGSPVVKKLGHPDAVAEGIFAMPDVTSGEGLALYGAILNLMAERWSRPDGKHGRVHHWIMHNEVDAGWVWTNAGEKTDIVFMDLYQRSMRLMDLIARQYDPNSRTFISLTHHWANRGEARWYGSRRLLELLRDFCAAEGDFPWALAYHPYPQNLFNPRAWEDGQATFSFDSEKITPKNLEVLDAYMKQPAFRYQGKLRPVHLSENGFNSKDYSEKELADQAAGMALAWKKMAALSSIESWQYHNWIDNRHEGGLKIGLRKFPDDETEPLGKKPIWHLYQALGTRDEDKLAKPYLEVIGLKDWSGALHRMAEN
ncbi:DUF5722 domain-containing protein [Luteolibacter sp. GHJ8]|uniref:DUF5722 domain-containing protein n=1 Tax=Luteolibacter rhizosphaerae TaxID=2989719 RepID=A0ABT3G3E5_9BACT|nr:DUF5722 domain-containing protein [Luteolibacter rhizosphaerae]MCW1914011.1 DUF5722 domain-containing protein [Luteolibacter rhizosphaerae]